MSDPPIENYNYDSSNGVTTYYGGGLAWTQTYDRSTGNPIRSYSPTSPIVNSTIPVITIPSSNTSGNALVLGAVASVAAGSTIASSIAGTAEGVVAESAVQSGTQSVTEAEEAELQKEFEERLWARLEEMAKETPKLARMSQETVAQALVGGTFLAILAGSAVLSHQAYAGPITPTVVILHDPKPAPVDPETQIPIFSPKKNGLFVDPDALEVPVYPYSFYRKKKLREFSFS
jgi:hypothetical protein